jgi:NAD(P)-dependent dehydrogenase (short-subunit alcohol dehydrogenase family)
MRIDGITAVVTGGASGLGRATAELLAERGARVVAVDLAGGADDGSAGDAPGSIEMVGADVRDPDGIAAVVAHANEGSELRVLVNCAGVGDSGRTVGRDGPLDLDAFRRVVEINLVGTFNMIRLAAAAMATNEPREGDRGVVVNTASIAAFDGQVGQAAYSASKAGIAGMTLPIARDLSRSLIRVMTIAPGLFDTAMFDTVATPVREALEASVPHPARLGEPTEYASLVAHIVENPVLNGETIRLDGAVRMPPR